jgi:predicted phosphodiesterase
MSSAHKGSDAYVGILFIGDPHLEGRQPEFRKDDFPNVILNKLRWCLDYAARERLLPAILGDLFDKPRDNPNWMIVAMLEMFEGREVIGIYGNHDCANPQLDSHDSLSVIVKSGRFRIVDADSPWKGEMNSRSVVIGGSSYRQAVPKKVDFATYFHGQNAAAPLAAWMTHHDLKFPGYDAGRISPCAIDGLELVVNGHIHTRGQAITVGKTQWWNPGNISRRRRTDATKGAVPSALRMDATVLGWRGSYIEIPHAPYNEVFHESVSDPQSPIAQSQFITGLADLQARRTASGAGLKEFLAKNLTQFAPEVANEINKLTEQIQQPT